jgi:hypothetical protein
LTVDEGFFSRDQRYRTNTSITKALSTARLHRRPRESGEGMVKEMYPARMYYQMRRPLGAQRVGRVILEDHQELHDRNGQGWRFPKQVLKDFRQIYP